MKKKNKALFLDRDGVINKNYGYVFSMKNFLWLKNVKKAIKYAYVKKYLIIIISNQSGVARGYYNEKDIKKLHNQINKELMKIDCKIHDFFYCPYHPKYGTKKYKKNSYLRKPNPGMIIKAIKKWNIDKKSSLMIGDKKIDMIAAKKVGLRFIMKKYNLMREVKKNLSSYKI
ncbi:MAG: D-glycero-D-manno-heptose 1,7-bisphosphate phosphatase [Pelagibacterales bacterium]|nr:D-glycero-D-manno-heptose 1,7-bisphosphate phosphatase [Pelagibacterales bacterium]